MTSHSGQTPIQFPLSYCPVTLRRVFPSNWVGMNPPDILPYPYMKDQPHLTAAYAQVVDGSGGTKCTPSNPCKMTPELGAFGSPVAGVAPTEGMARIRGPPLATMPLYDEAAFPSDVSQGWAYPGPKTAW